MIKSRSTYAQQKCSRSAITVSRLKGIEYRALFDLKEWKNGLGVAGTTRLLRYLTLWGFRIRYKNQGSLTLAITGCLTDRARQGIQIQQEPGIQSRHPLDAIHQFTHISRPIVIDHRSLCFI